MQAIKKRKSKKIYIILALVLLVGSLFSAPSIALGAGDNGVYVNADQDTKTMYYLRLPILDEKLYLLSVNGFDLSPLMQNQSGVFGWTKLGNFAKSESNRFHTFIITYNNILVNDNAVLTSRNIKTNISHNTGFNTEQLTFTILPDKYGDKFIDINIRSEYYDLLNGGDFSNLTISFFYNGFGFPLSNRDTKTGFWLSQTYKPTFGHNFDGIGVHQREVPADYDPILEEGQAGDNGGFNKNPADPNKPSSTFEKWLADIFGISVGELRGIINTIFKVIFIVACSIALLVALTLISKIIRWMLGK